TILEISRTGGRLVASGRIAGYREGAVLGVHMHIDAQGVRPNDRGVDPRRIHGGAIVGARLIDTPNWAAAVIIVGGSIAAEATPSGVRALRPEYPIATPRLRLRPLTMDDIPALLEYRGRAEVCRYLPFEPMDADVLIQRLAGDMGRRAIAAEGESLTLGVELAESGRLIGDVVLFYRSAEHAGGELGYVFHPDVAGQGFATEACAAVLDLAFDPGHGLALHRVIALMDARNTDSARLATRLGLRQEAHHRSAELFKGEWSDLLIYAVLAEERAVLPQDRAVLPQDRAVLAEDRATGVPAR
ncbi:MAG: acetyltransferase, partial [Jatrophihabitantaceae bacterium]|nr:acetyltransferase [Jatrophihabitantaceae bacterium]